MDALADPQQQQSASSSVPSAASVTPQQQQQQQHAFQMNGPSAMASSAMMMPGVSAQPVGSGGATDAYEPRGSGSSHHMTRQQQQLHLQQQQFHAQQMRQHQSMDMMGHPYAPHPYARERTPTPPNLMMHRTASGGMLGGGAGVGEQRAVHLLAVCESCLLVVRVSGYDMSFRRIVERKCPRCAGSLTLPQENMEMFILYGHYIPESVGATIVLGTLGLHPTLRADFVAAVMNELLIPLQTDFVYDVALPKRPDGLGMSLRMNKGDLVVGGFIDFEGSTESPSVAARIIAAGDVLVAINKKSIVASSFETNIRMLSHAASPVYLTFRRKQAVALL